MRDASFAGRHEDERRCRFRKHLVAPAGTRTLSRGPPARSPTKQRNKRLTGTPAAVETQLLALSQAWGSWFFTADNPTTGCDTGVARDVARLPAAARVRRRSARHERDKDGARRIGPWVA